MITTKDKLWPRSAMFRKQVESQRSDNRFNLFTAIVTASALLVLALDPPPQEVDDDLALEFPLFVGEEPQGRSLNLWWECEGGSGEDRKRGVMRGRNEGKSNAPPSADGAQLSRVFGVREVTRVSLDGELNRSSGNFLVMDDRDGLGGERRVDDDAGRQRNVKGNGIRVRSERPADRVIGMVPERYQFDGVEHEPEECDRGEEPEDLPGLMTALAPLASLASASVAPSPAAKATAPRACGLPRFVAPKFG